MSKAVTIRDVARRAGVSVATASRVLNGKMVVKAETRDRILAVMDEIGFTPSPAARRLSLGRTLTVGVVVSFLTRPQAVERIRGVDAVLSDSELDMVIFNVESLAKRDHYLGTLAHARRADGLLVISLPPTDEAISALIQGPVPVVFVDVHTTSIAAFPRIVGDDIAGGGLAARHLADLGHTRIAFIGDALANPFGFTSSRDREAGVTRELATRGITIPRHWIGHAAHGRYQARELALQMLSSNDRPTAIVAASDTQALGVIAAARERGLHVPDDLSVVGYDDIEAAEYVGLTTIRQQLFESGRRGAEILMSEIEARSEGPTVTRLAPEIVVRATTAPVKEGRG